MFSAKRSAWVWFLLAILVPSLLMAAEPTKSRKAKGTKPAEVAAPAAPPESVELFKAIDAQQVSVQIVPNNAEVAHIFVTNLTKKPLAVQLPTVFAAKPVLAQFQVPGGQQQGNQNNTGFLQNNGQTPQIIGGPKGIGRNNPGNGPFNVPPGKVVDVRVPVVCLQYGNPDPRPDIPYQLVTLDSVLKNPELKMMLEEFGEGKFDQPVAQLAAWHFSNGLDLNALANTGYAPARLGEVSRVIQYIREKVKADSVTETKTATTSSRATVVPETPGISK
jgi:hypothetical protein